MESVRHDLVLLVRLQATYDRIAVAIRGMDTEGNPVQLRIVGNTYNLFRIDDLDAATAIPVTLDSLWIYNGAANKGGGVYSTEALTVIGCIVEESSASSGSASKRARL